MPSRFPSRAIGAIAICLSIACPARAQTPEAYQRAREAMVRDFIEKEGVHNPRVLQAMRTVPRHEFMPSALRSKAYVDAAWSIGFKQTISPPFVVAYMTQAIDPQPTDRVLEIGTGSGYQAAILSMIVKEVYSIEIVEQLGRSAAARLKHLNYDNVKTKVGDGYLGWPEHAPFDKIIVTCSPENVPKPLVDQLKEGGRMIIPLGERYHQDVYLLEKNDGKLVRKQLMPTFFVPMTGRSESERTVKPNPLKPRITNGNFEQLDDDGTPAAWHYQRQMTLVKDEPTTGKTCVRFDNLDPGRLAAALQGTAVDGRSIAVLHLKFKVRANQIADGSQREQRAGIEVYFYDSNRRQIAEGRAAQFSGTSAWHDASGAVAVPLPRARRSSGLD